MLEGHSDLEKEAYIGTIASIATADRQATEEELDHISELCGAASLPAERQQAVMDAARGTSGVELTHYLDILKTSELRYSLVADLLAFAKTDENYEESEQQHVSRIARYLGLDEQQYSLLSQFAEKASESPEAGPQMLSSGLGGKLQGAGINTGSLFKGLLGTIGPMLLAGMLSRGRGGGLGRGMSGGGLGSLIGMLGGSGGGGLGSAGGLLGRILGGR